MRLSDLENPSKYGMRQTKYVKIPIASNRDRAESVVSSMSADKADPFFGGWMMASDKYEIDEKDTTTKVEAAAAKTEATVILYLHENAETISQRHRIELYQVRLFGCFYFLAVCNIVNVIRQIYQKMGYHVLLFDYRGYGSSTYVKPKESTLVSDAQTAWNWLQGMNKNGFAEIVVYGHSLGTGVASKLANILVGKGNVCDY
jgi:hypothetical protein